MTWLQPQEGCISHGGWHTFCHNVYSLALVPDVGFQTKHTLCPTHTEVPESFNLPQCLATPLINGSSTTLWEIRVMKSDSGVHADSLHLVYFSRRWGARLWSEKATNILILEGGGVVSSSGILMNQNGHGHLASCRCKTPHHHWLIWRTSYPRKKEDWKHNYASTRIPVCIMSVMQHFPACIRIKGSI